MAADFSLCRILFSFHLIGARRYFEHSRRRSLHAAGFTFNGLLLKTNLRYRLYHSHRNLRLSASFHGWRVLPRILMPFSEYEPFSLMPSEAGAETEARTFFASFSNILIRVSAFSLIRPCLISSYRVGLFREVEAFSSRAFEHTIFPRFIAVTPPLGYTEPTRHDGRRCASASLSIT